MSGAWDTRDYLFLSRQNLVIPYSTQKDWFLTVERDTKMEPCQTQNYFEVGPIYKLQMRSVCKFRVNRPIFKHYITSYLFFLKCVPIRNKNSHGPKSTDKVIKVC